jgi:predicted Zn-dependent protease
MAEFISCPACQRRLRLPSELPTEIVRCPACHNDFPLSSVLSAPPNLESSLPSVLPADLPSEAEKTETSASPVRSQHSPQPRLRVQRSSRKTCLLVLLIMGLAVFTLSAGIVVLVLVWRATNDTLAASRYVEDEEEKPEQVRQAFRNQPPLDEARMAPELQSLFDALGVSLRAADTESIVRQFDVSRMADEFGNLAIVPPRHSRNRAQFLNGMRQGIGTSFTQRAILFQWTTSEIRKIKKINDEEAVVIARHKHPNQATLKVRWWVTRRSGGWKVYDLEDLDVGMRFSTTVASVMAQGAGRLSDISKAAITIGEVFQALAGNDVDTAENKLKPVPAQLPPHLQTLRRLATGVIHLHREQYQEALDALDSAKRLHADMPIADYLRGVAYNRLGKWEQAFKNLREYRDLLGDDDDICRELGEALRGLSRFAEAAVEYRKALDLNPKDADAFRGFLNALEGNAKKDDIGPRFAKLDNLRENFALFAEDCEQRAFPQLLEPLVLTMRRLDPDYPLAEYYLALVTARTGHPDEAVKLFQAALRKEKEEKERKEHSRHFLQVMTAMGHTLAAYRALPDARAAFRDLASEAKYRLDDLKALVTAHRQKHADDPLLLLYEAEIHVREGNYAAADKKFANAVAHQPDEEQLNSFRASRVLARYHNGQMLSAYREIGPRKETFLQLANLCFNAQDDAQLETLLVEHAKNEPASTEVARFRCRLAIRNKKVAEGIALFKSVIAKPLEKEKRAELLAEFLGDMVEADKPIEAYRAAPDAREAFEILADDLEAEQRWNELRLLAQAHRAADPADLWLAYHQGEIHLHDKQWQKAADALSQAVKQAPKELHDRFRGSYVYAMYKAGRGRQAYIEADSRDSTFEQLANLMTADKKGVELEELVRLHRPHAGDDPRLLYQECRAKLLLKKPEEASALFRTAYKKDSQEYRRSAESRQFLLDMAEAGRFLDGFRAVPNSTVAFESIAPTLVFQKKRKELKALLEEYGKGRDGDSSLAFYQGESALLEGDAKTASRHFASAVAKGGTADQGRYRQGLFRARIELGEAAAVYEQFHKEAGILEQFAGLCEQKKDAGQLQALLDAHRKHKPDDAALTAWELEVRWLKRDYEGALRLLREHRRDVFALARYQWKADDHLVRCLVKLKRHPEAIQEAETAVKKRFSDRLLLVLAYAAVGDVRRTMQTMEKTRANEYLLRRCYEDAELGPILISEAFRSVREKYPKPGQEPERRFSLPEDD